MLGAEMTMSEMLHDPMIRQMLRADGVSLGEFASIMEAAASATHRKSMMPKRSASLPAEWHLWRSSAAQTALVQQANLLLKRC